MPVSAEAVEDALQHAQPPNVEQVDAEFFPQFATDGRFGCLAELDCPHPKAGKRSDPSSGRGTRRRGGRHHDAVRPGRSGGLSASVEGIQAPGKPNSIAAPSKEKVPPRTRAQLPRIKRDAIVLTGIDAGSPGDPMANGCRSSPCAVELLSPTCADPYGSTPSSTAGRDADLRGAPYGRLVRARAAGTPGQRCPIARLCSTGIAASRSLRPWSPGATGQ